MVYGDYFSTFGIPLIRGRNFTRDEQMQNRQAVIVSKNLADRFRLGEDPIGRRLKWGLADSDAEWQTVVGVAGDVVDGPLGIEPAIHAYVPFSEPPDEELASPLAGGLLRHMMVAVNGECRCRIARHVRARSDRGRRSGAGRCPGDDDGGGGR